MPNAVIDWAIVVVVILSGFALVLFSFLNGHRKGYRDGWDDGCDSANRCVRIREGFANAKRS